MDDQITLSELKDAVHRFVDARDWYDYHTAKNLAMCIAIEAAEIMEHFQWLNQEQGRQMMADPANRVEVADELADVLIYCLSFANATGIDVATAVMAKLERNETRFPIEEARNRLGTTQNE